VTISQASSRQVLSLGILIAGVAISPHAFAQDGLSGWDLTSSVTLRGGFENVDSESSHFLVAAPEFSIGRTEDDFTASVSGSAELDQLGQDEFSLRSIGLQGSYGLRLNQHAQFELGLNYALSQPRAVEPDLPTDVKLGGHEQQLGLNAAYNHQFSKTAIQLRGSVDRSQMSASLLGDDTYQSNADQNGWIYSLGTRVSREITPMVGAFIDAQLNRSRFDASSTALTAMRDNWSYEAQIGASVNFDERLQGDVSIGQLRQTFDDTSLAEVQTLTYNAALQWRATNTTQLLLDVNTSVSPSTDAGEAMRIVDVGRLTLNHQLNTKLQMSVFGELERQHYQTSTDETKTSRAGIGVQYQASEQLSAFANYNFALREEPSEIGRTHRIEAGLRFNRL